MLTDWDKMKALLIKHEGEKLKLYTDTVGKITGGIGHNFTDVGISQAASDFIYNEDRLLTKQFLDRNVQWWNNLDDVRARALFDLTFDIRASVLGFHHMLDGLQHGNWQQAHDELLASTFAKQTGQRAIDLAQMFLTGQDL